MLSIYSLLENVAQTISINLTMIIMEITKLIELLEKKLNPEYENDVFTWFQIRKSLKSIYFEASDESLSVRENEGEEKNKSLEDEEKEILDMTNVPRDLLNKPFTI
jgi:hypothetical protein